MSDLSQEYAGRARFDVRDVNTDEGREAVQRYGWADARHGLVTLTPDGEMVGNLPGHRYGKAEVKAKIEELLANSGG